MNQLKQSIQNSVERLNQEFDELRINRDFEGMLKLVKDHEYVLRELGGWKTADLIKSLETILKIERTL